MSSVISRIFRREGTSKLGLGDREGVNKNAPPTFVPEIIRGKYWTVTSLEHLDFVARHDPVANFIVYGVPEMIFDDGFVLVDEKGEELPNNKKIQRELRRLNAKRVFTQCLAAARGFGWCYQYTGKNRYIPTVEGGKIASLHCFTPIECVVHEYDDFGNAIKMKINLTVGKGASQENEVLYLPAKDFIVWNLRPLGRGDTGMSELEAIWDMLVYIRYMFHSMGWYDMKIGTGLFVAYTESGFGDESKGKWDTSFADISIKRVFLADKSEIAKLEFVGPTGQVTDFVAHIQMCIQTISVPTRLPYELLMGAAAGAVTGSETNITLGDEFERKVKGMVEEYILETIKRMGWNDEPLFEWIVKSAQTEENKAKIEQTHSQAMNQKLPYLTIDEIRAEEGYGPLPDGRGDKLSSESDPLSEFSKAFGGETPNEQEPNNAQGDQVG